jgi:hypothetical protein
MDFTITGALVSGYLLALARTAGFILVAPPFNTRAFPARVRASLALALAIPLSTWTMPTAPALGSNPMIGQMLLQILMGVTLGFFVQLAVAAIQTVGDLIDVAGGFSISIGNDPLLLVQSSVMGRLHQLIAVTLLFVGEGHLVIPQSAADARTGVAPADHREGRHPGGVRDVPGRRADHRADLGRDADRGHRSRSADPGSTGVERLRTRLPLEDHAQPAADRADPDPAPGHAQPPD